jgi:hypothetical protein
MIQEILIADDGIFPGNKLTGLLRKNVPDIPLLFPAMQVNLMVAPSGLSARRLHSVL